MLTATRSGLTSALGTCAAFLLAVAAPSAAQSAPAQSAPAQSAPAQSAPAQSAPAGSTEVPAVAVDTLPAGPANRVPYRSERSFLRRVLAAPASALHYATRPLGWAVKEAEERFPQVFAGHLPPYGAYPIVETGGASGFAGGVVLFYDDLPWGGPGTTHDAEVRALVGSRVYNRFEGRYAVSGLLGGTTALHLRGRHANDPREYVYVGGNDAGEDRRAFYATDETDVQLEAVTDWSPRVETQGRLRFQHMNVEPGEAAIERDEGEVPLGQEVPGVGTTTLASAAATVALDLASQTERSVEGTRLRLGTGYTQRLGSSEGRSSEGRSEKGRSESSDDFRYLRYWAEAVQFVPLPFLPPKRRLVLRALLDKAEPLGTGRDGGRVPFYRLPGLGGTQRLRGYRTDRFQQEGALLLTAEYRWPVWHNLDALLLVEAGQVFANYRDLAPGRFHVGYGGGFHLVTGSRLAFRFELAGSREGLRTILTVQPAF